MLMNLALAMVLIAGSEPSSSEHKPSEFQKASAEAKANAQTPDAKAYAKALATSDFGKRLSTTFLDCSKLTNRGAEFSRPAESPQPLSSRYTVLIRVGLDGAVGEVLLRPRNNIAACVRRELLRLELPKPPSDSYWFRMESTLSTSP